MNSFEQILSTQEETEAFAKQLANSLRSPQVIALYGDLGVGKTTFVKAFISTLHGGDKIRVKSPSYALHHHYGTVPESHHLDLVRMTNLDQIEALGLMEIIQGNHGFVLIEWPEIIEGDLPKSTIKMIFTLDEKDQRKVELKELPAYLAL